MATKKPSSNRRAHVPLTPCASIFFLNKKGITELSPQDITKDKVGLKAYGLASIPQCWTKPFIVVSDDAEPEPEILVKILEYAGIQSDERVIVRSSGANESLVERGSFESDECTVDEIIGCFIKLKKRIALNHKNPPKLHWIIQSLIPCHAKGHLSNERRLCHALRDWVAEVEALRGYAPETHKIAIRPWRDARNPKIDLLLCPYRVNYTDRLEDIARWTYERQERVHYEWVWDGTTIYVVQADVATNNPAGVNPKELLPSENGCIKVDNLKIFHRAEQGDFSNYRKLSNANIYKSIGYELVAFFVLDDAHTIHDLLTNGRCSQDLLHDLKVLTKKPLVLRTDGVDIPTHQHQMLPRSDELRSIESAQRWLETVFRAKIINAHLNNCQLCLIAHHFVPAAASCWCKADPDMPRVRIESLWGIPEGLYWYAHDVFDVDTKVTSMPPDTQVPNELPINERLRYKGRFIAPNESGKWILHHTSAEADWRASISKKEWIREIAWVSRNISTILGKSVIIMWFIDITSADTPHKIMPWYHEELNNEQAQATPKAAPRKKLASSTEFKLRTNLDWNLLQKKCASGESIARVLVDPIEPEIVRDQQFAKSLATLAKNQHFVIELAGGILSHAFYMLSNTGCEVECSDLYAADDEELEFNKLVRDKIPSTILKRGEHVEQVTLNGEAVIAALKRKIIEEAFEVADAKTSVDIIEELADLREVMNSLMKRLSITDDEINITQKKKAIKRGAFDDGLMLSKTVLSFHAGAAGQSNSDFLSTPRLINKSISKVEDLPSYTDEIHLDKRFNEEGIEERQFTMNFPAHAEGFVPARVNFFLNAQSGQPHEMVLEVNLSRVDADLRCRLRLLNAPTQLQLPLSNHDN